MRLSISLVLLGVFAWLVGGVFAFQRHQNDAQPHEIARGVVSRLDPAPYHAHVTVTPARGAPFTWFTASRTPLQVGQVVDVRLSPGAPETAELVEGTGYGTAIDLGLIGLALLIGALIAPWLLARFPGIFASPIR
ncbi:hypothetical protein [Polymorphobacter megasporae]|uniref:hypothetical protein n=1 Tax=Glacieibacterium megasporae TaxID=2835787 RepID=UPI001C1E5436|nr:hypothetical protein [Polymorphobacter megasporae]UAJ10289.1 hypothetical protein KTC28_00500 [Polymorphobacter megasporae]